MSKLKPPIAPQRAHSVSSPHGMRSDPYYWLRDDERADPEVLAYLTAENAYHAEHLAPVKPLEDKIYAEIVGRLKQDDATVPYRKNGYWYYIRYEPGKEHPIFARRRGSLEAAEEVMLDANELATGHEYYQVGEIDVSPDGQWMAFCEDAVGRRQYVLRFKNLATGEILAERIDSVEADLAWANDNKTVLYIEKDLDTLLGLR
ncbi:MAG: S9 family peptidase, partial [Pseudomonadota bacterium]|nr:S9 family peptidase [Pseudomonadota bacterium]